MERKIIEFEKNLDLKDKTDVYNFFSNGTVSIQGKSKLHLKYNKTKGNLITRLLLYSYFDLIEQGQTSIIKSNIINNLLDNLSKYKMNLYYKLYNDAKLKKHLERYNSYQANIKNLNNLAKRNIYNQNTTKSFRDLNNYFFTYVIRVTELGNGAHKMKESEFSKRVRRLCLQGYVF